MISHLWFLFRAGIVLFPHTYACWNSTNQQDLKPPILKFEAPEGKLQLWCQGTQSYVIWLFLSQADSRGGGREEGKGKGEEDGILIAPTLLSHSWISVLWSSPISFPFASLAASTAQPASMGRVLNLVFPAWTTSQCRNLSCGQPPSPPFTPSFDSPLPTQALQGPPHPHPRCDCMIQHSCQDKMDYLSWPNSQSLSSTHRNCLSEKKNSKKKEYT